MKIFVIVVIRTCGIWDVGEVKNCDYVGRIMWLMDALIVMKEEYMV